MVNRIINSGKRKRAVARASLEEGTGRVWLNGKDYKNLSFFDKLKIEEPLRLAESVLGKLNFDARITVKGGGEKGQIEAARIALTKSILDFSKSKELTKVVLEYDRSLIVADVRRKEANKPGDSKARSRRQKSYR
ncbi:30S ribosomal protein S9 [Candidatus Pacearchaeota archaeon]|jgi:ribosomal protein S9|nr:30S ribosomal protein S9 [Candidatus Pacearchaeota archaeon]